MIRRLAAAMAAAIPLMAPAAVAAPSDVTYRGGCAYAVVSDGTDDAQTTWEGVAAVAVVAMSGSAPSLTLVDARCDVYRNGTNPTTVVESNGVGVASNATSYAEQSDPNDILTICLVVNGSVHGQCGDVWTLEAADTTREVYGIAKPWTDAAACPLIDWIGPGVPGLVEASWGELYVAGRPVYSCWSSEPRGTAVGMRYYVSPVLGSTQS